MPRTSVQSDLSGGAAAAIQAAKGSKSFKKAPGAQPSRKRQPDSDTDLIEWSAELFSQDEIRDDDAGEAISELVFDEGDDSDAIAAAEALIADGIADGWRRQQGGIVATEKGRIKKWVKKAARSKGRVVDTQLAKAVKQSKRMAGWDYGLRVERRIEALGASMFQSTGGLTDERRRLLIEGFKKDRERRGWRVPKL